MTPRAARLTLGALVDVGVELPIIDCLPGSGIMDERREPPLAESERAGDAGFGLSGVFADANAASKTSLKNGFLVAARSAICSSGTVSLFFSRNPSTSYVTSSA